MRACCRQRTVAASATRVTVEQAPWRRGAAPRRRPPHARSLERQALPLARPSDEWLELLLVEHGEQRQLKRAWSVQPHVPVTPRSRHGVGQLLGARVDEPLRRRLGVDDLEREPDRRRDTFLPDLDPVDQSRLVDREQLERRVAGVEDRSAARRLSPLPDQRQPQDVAIEAHRALVVLHGDGQAELGNRARHAHAMIRAGHNPAVTKDGDLTGQLLKLQSVTDAALAFLSVDELLQELLERARSIFGCDTAAILLLDESKGELVARAAKGLEEEVERGVRIPLGRGFAGRIAAERRPVIIDDVDHADVLNPILREKGIKSLLGAPLIVRGRVLGVIHVGTLTPRDFTAEDADLLQQAAERAALGLEKALVHDQLVRLDQVRQAFISIASHELRTPTSVVLGAALTLHERGDQLPEEQKRELTRVLAGNAQRLATLIEQLLDLSRIEARSGDVRPVRLRVRERLEEIIGESAPANVDVELDVDPELEAVADPAALDRVVSNLVANAKRHGRPPIVVAADRTDSMLRISVCDSGPGVAADVLPRLFEEFARSADAHDTPGSGLGLAIARSYARALGGDLVYDRDSLGGSRFTLTVPSG